MQIQSFSPRIPQGVSRPAQQSQPSLNGDHFQANLRNPQDLIPGKFIQNKGGDGGKTALQLAGIGVMFGGILASTNLPSGWVGVGIIGSMCTGLALMSLANK
ncbi:hypothetical protein JST97_21470 [bacterium]|nr:hypothetical protein [bacterium]